MDSSHWLSIGELLRITGPYGLVTILGWAFWRLSEKKDAHLRELYAQVIDMSAAQTAAITKMESALVMLKEALTVSIRKR